ncbi:MAG: signal peptidase I [Synechococcus sp.]
MPEPLRWLLTNDITSTLLAALVLTLIIRTFIAEPRWIPSESMLPTLEVGDRLVVEKLSYRFSDPSRGDIVVFIPPDHLETDDAFIKRVVGLPGDTIEIRLDDGIYVNGERLDESYVFELPTRGFSYAGNITILGELKGYPVEGNSSNAPIVVPDDHYFVLGDNRNNSQDSHVWGFLPRENIIGRTFVRFWPFRRFHYFPVVQYPELDASANPALDSTQTVLSN